MLNKDNLNVNLVRGVVHSDKQKNKTIKFDCRGGCFSSLANEQNGITLIALIITIIVMLILVGVTINVALNGGLLRKTELAKTEVNKALEKEELIQIAIGEYNVQTNAVNVNAIKEKTQADYTETGTSIEGKTLVLQGKSGTLWEINLNTAEVREYKTPEFYGFCYYYEWGSGSNTQEMKMYFLENGICINITESRASMGASKYIRNGNKITITESYTEGNFSENYETFSGNSISAKRNENDIYVYKPIQNSEYKIYSNALYISDESDNIISTGDSYITNDIFMTDLYAHFSEMESKGITLIDDTGKKILYNNETYTLMEAL